MMAHLDHPDQVRVPRSLGQGQGNTVKKMLILLRGHQCVANILIKSRSLISSMSFQGGGHSKVEL